MPARQRRWRRPALILAVACLVAGLAVVVFLSYGQARAFQDRVTVPVKAGQAEIQSGEALLKKARHDRSPAEVAQARTHFVASHDHFARARSLAASDTWVNRAVSVPLLGNYVQARVQAVEDISRMGDALADAGSDGGDVELLLINPRVGKDASGGKKLLSFLTDSPPAMDRLTSDLTRAQASANRVDPSLLPSGQRGTLLKARDTINRGLGGLKELKRLTPVLEEILGAQGRRIYLVEQLNPAELRSGGGFLGTESLVAIDHGDVTVVESGDSYALEPRSVIGDPTYVKPPSWMAAMPAPEPNWWHTHSWNFWDSNLFPSFSSNAKWAEWFTQKDLKVKVNGVIALDYYTVASLLQLTGPIQLPSFGITFNSANFVPTAFRLDVTSGAHKSVLTEAVQPLIQRLSALPPDRWTDLTKAMNSDVTQRHLQVYFDNPGAQQEMTRAGWSRNLNPTQAPDFMLETEDNLAFTKANYFVTRSYSLTLSRTANGLHHVVSVDITDSPPANYPAPIHYGFYVRLYVPTSATNVALKMDEPKLLVSLVTPTDADGAPPGARTIGGWAYISAAPGKPGRGRLIFEYDTPWDSSAQGEHLIYWQKQPGTTSDKVSISWSVSGHTYTTNGDLSEDRLIALGASSAALRTANPGRVELPGFGLGSS